MVGRSRFTYMSCRKVCRAAEEMHALLETMIVDNNNNGLSEVKLLFSTYHYHYYYYYYFPPIPIGNSVL